VRSFNDRQRAIISTYKGFELEVRLRLYLRDLGVRTDLGEDGNAPSKGRIDQPVVLSLLSAGRVSMRSMANKDEGREPSLVGTLGVKAEWGIERLSQVGSIPALFRHFYDTIMRRGSFPAFAEDPR
jgi:hypothetical protein